MPAYLSSVKRLISNGINPGKEFEGNRPKGKMDELKNMSNWLTYIFKDLLISTEVAHIFIPLSLTLTVFLPHSSP